MITSPEERLRRILDMGWKLIAWLEENQITAAQIEEDYTIQ